MDDKTDHIQPCRVYPPWHIHYFYLLDENGRPCSLEGSGIPAATKEGYRNLAEVSISDFDQAKSTPTFNIDSLSEFEDEQEQIKAEPGETPQVKINRPWYREMGRRGGRW